MMRLPQVQVGRKSMSFLLRRGARSDKGRGSFNYTAVIQRSLDALDAILRHADPRRTLPRDYYEAALRLLTDPWELSLIEIEYIEAYLARQDALETALAALDEETFLGAIKALTFYEKYALVDLAIQFRVLEAQKSESAP